MDVQHADAPRSVIVISSHVVRGAVGNRAAVFALETLGFPVWAVPTVILPWHPGHGRGTRIVPDADQFASLLGDLEKAPWLGEVAAVLSGYLGHASQVRPVASLVKAVRARNPKALYVCDPVMGDKGGLYVAQDIAEVNPRPIVAYRRYRHAESFRAGVAVRDQSRRHKIGDGGRARCRAAVDAGHLSSGNDERRHRKLASDSQ